jgi:hypothetical protein
MERVEVPLGVLVLAKLLVASLKPFSRRLFDGQAKLARSLLLQGVKYGHKRLLGPMTSISRMEEDLGN